MSLGPKYDKIVNYFGANKNYSKKRIIEGLVKLGMVPEGKGSISRLIQNIAVVSGSSVEFFSRNGNDLLFKNGK